MKTIEKENEKGTYAIYCPGCKTTHYIPTITPLHNRAIWLFNGNLEKPSFKPSINIGYGEPTTERCHFVINNGMISYCGDTTHQYRNQVIELPDIVKPEVL